MADVSVIVPLQARGAVHLRGETRASQAGGGEDRRGREVVLCTLAKH